MANNLLVDDVQEILVKCLAEELAKEVDEIDVTQAFSTLGMDSLDAAAICNRLEERLGGTLEPSIFYDYPTPQALAAYLAANAS